jgi:hypothetical protein
MIFIKLIWIDLIEFYGSSLFPMGNLRIAIGNLLMQHLVKSPTCGAIDIDSITNKRSPGNLAITMTRLKNSRLPTQNNEEPFLLSIDSVSAQIFFAVRRVPG